MNPTIVSARRWCEARLALLEQERALTRARDALAASRRAMPWVLVDRAYSFKTEAGIQSPADLFGESSQLIVYHFTYGPDEETACPSCSFWADNYNGTLAHLRERDINFVAVSRGPLDTLLAYRQRFQFRFRRVVH
jgi:predicted dithiol-disulfide oxidoreductase (DUF899 family)